MLMFFKQIVIFVMDGYYSKNALLLEPISFHTQKKYRPEILVIVLFLSHMGFIVPDPARATFGTFQVGTSTYLIG